MEQRQGEPPERIAMSVAPWRIAPYYPRCHGRVPHALYLETLT